MRVVIIGNGVAGITAARTVRVSSPDVEITVFTDEPYPYYLRPKLIDFLARQCETEELYTYSPAWYEKRRINVHINQRIKKIHPAEKKVGSDNGSLPYDKLLLANRSSPFLPPIKGIDKGGVFSLRTLRDAIAIKEWTHQAKTDEDGAEVLRKQINGLGIEILLDCATEELIGNKKKNNTGYNPCSF